jgi:hypothetical protein
MQKRISIPAVGYALGVDRAADLFRFEEDERRFKSPKSRYRSNRPLSDSFPAVWLSGSGRKLAGHLGEARWQNETQFAMLLDPNGTNRTFWAVLAVFRGREFVGSICSFSKRPQTWAS